MSRTTRAASRRDYRRIPLGMIVAALGLVASIGWSQTTPALAGATPQSCSLYASNSGSDGNVGSQSAPFRTLSKLASSLKAGQTGCLQSGQTFDSEGNVFLNVGETHGREGQPVTITSTDPDEPATITHMLSFEHGVNYLTFTHVDFNWSMPKPWACWNAEGNAIPGEVISGPGKCIAGTQSAEDAVQIGMGGKDDSLTYDDITSDGTNICINLGGYGDIWGEGNVIEHDRIHNCGPTVEATTSGFPIPNEEWGWHSHGIYDYAHGTIIKNDYIYDNSRDGVLLYGGGEGAIVEHNILDHNGAGIWFGDNKNDRAAWNIITNSTSPRAVVDYGIGSYEPGSGNVATDNCLDGNLSGEIEHGNFTSTDNKTGTNPLYVNTEEHKYTLQADSPCLGYGPDTAQPVTSELGEVNPPEVNPPSGEATLPTGEANPATAPSETIPLSSAPTGVPTSPIETEASGSADAPKVIDPSNGTAQKLTAASRRRRSRVRTRRAAAASAHRRARYHRRRGN
jgi:hypothetical protein